MKHFFIALIFISQFALGQSPESIKVIDLKEEIRSHDNNNNYVEFLIDARFSQGILEIKSDKVFGVFINSDLYLTAKEKLIINIDSLIREKGRITAGIFSRYGIDELEVRILFPGAEIQSTDNWFSREGNEFLNFSIICILILLTWFIALFRIHTKLTMDYLNFLRLFSLRERDDLVEGRITSSVNFIFYLFFSFFSAFILEIVFHYTNVGIYHLFQNPGLSILGYFKSWGLLSFAIFTLIIVKLILLYSLSGLFQMGEALPLQFLNFIRISFLAFSLISAVCLVMFLFDLYTTDSHSIPLDILSTAYIIWLFLIFLKLMPGHRFRLFHLFLYLCGSEIIPIVVLIKTLY